MKELHKESHAEPVRVERLERWAGFPAVPGSKPIGKLLVETGKIGFLDIDAIERRQQERGLRFGEAAVSLGLVQDVDVQTALARQFDYAYLVPGQPEAQAFSPELALAYAPFGDRAEAFRRLRSQLNLRLFGLEDATALAVAGLDRGDGCSYVAANLAVAFSQLGVRTLLVDANLREPRQHRIFGLAQRQGLADVLAGRRGTEVIAEIGVFGNLAVLPAGTVPPNPQELLDRPAFAALLRECGRIYPVVIVDTPAANRYADTQIIAANTRHVLLVVRKHQTRMRDLEAVKAHLIDARVEWVAAVFNDI